VKNLDKLRRYDALLTAWWRLHESYRGSAEPRAVVFVCPDEDAVFGLMRAAAHELTGRLANPSEHPDDWLARRRERVLFVAERDVHDGSLRAWKLPGLPPDGEAPRLLRARDAPARRRPVRRFASRRPVRCYGLVSCVGQHGLATDANSTESRTAGAFRAPKRNQHGADEFAGKRDPLPRQPTHGVGGRGMGEAAV
jgi:hypothetical protein